MAGGPLRSLPHDHHHHQRDAGCDRDAGKTGDEGLHIGRLSHRRRQQGGGPRGGFPGRGGRAHGTGIGIEPGGGVIAARHHMLADQIRCALFIDAQQGGGDG
jgi:hypothetical protein